MSNVTTQTRVSGKPLSFKQRSYGEIVEYLNNHWKLRTQTQLTAIKQLDKALGTPSKKLKTVMVTGINGKSLTIDFAAQLLKSEGLTVGSFTTPHILKYNERFSINQTLIGNKLFTELANEVINIAQEENISADTQDILTAMALVHFSRNNVDVALLEVTSDMIDDPVNVCTPNLLAITRVTSEQQKPNDENTTRLVDQVVALVRPGTHVLSADQSKITLQLMLEKVEAQQGLWGMPIRKLAPLLYPYEQLHGRSAALAERIARLFIQYFVDPTTLVIANSLLSKEESQRGRPTLEAKRKAQMNPRRTIEQFWRDTMCSVSSRFQLIEREKPSVLLDNAANIDALKNLFLGVRLLHYQRSQRPIKGITFIFACDKNQIKSDEFARNVRHFTKKNSGQILLCPIEKSAPGSWETSWDVDQIAADLKNMKIKTRTYQSFEQAFEIAKQTVDDRDGLIVITGSKSIISQYWYHKGIKKL